MDFTALSWTFLASSGFASESPRAPTPAPPVSRWRSSSSNDPTDQRVVIGKSRDTPIHRSLLFLECSELGTQRRSIGDDLKATRPVSVHAQLGTLSDGGGAPAGSRRRQLRGVLRGHGGHP